MAGINGKFRSQLAAIAFLRWRMFVHSLQTTRGQMEVVSRAIVGLLFAAGALGGACGLGAAAWFFVSHRNTEWLAFLLWPVFIFWQLFPIFAAAFTENLDAVSLLRFPLSFPAYFLVRLAYGAFDPATMMGTFWLFGIGIGATVAAPNIFPSAVAALAVFALLNVLLSRTLFAWLERWLAQRRTREILGVLFIFITLSFQLIGPLTRRYGHADRSTILRFVEKIVPIQETLPPGLAAETMARSLSGDPQSAAVHLGILSAYLLLISMLLAGRLRAEYRGENLSETQSSAAVNQQEVVRSVGWEVPGSSNPAIIVLTKEFRYLMRNGPMLFTLIVPVFMLIVLRSNGALIGHGSKLVFPGVAGYTLILLTNLVYNNFGGEGAGIQFYFSAPVSFRAVVAGKNLSHVAILLLELVFAWIGVSWIYRSPSPDVLVATLAGMLFATPVNLAAGNLLSLYFPKRIDASAFGRQRASPTTVLASFAIQIVVVGTAALVIRLTGKSGSYWIATLIFLALAGAALVGYAFALRKVDQIAFDRRDNLIAELTKA